MEKGKKRALSVLFLSAFIDYSGIAIVYPIFPYLLFDQGLTFFPPEAGDAIRGLWLGLLIALQPLLQFFTAPIYGMLSDRVGRRNLMQLSLVIAIIGYALALVGVMYQSLLILALYRVLVGIGAGNGSLLSAVIADVSKPEEKARNYGLLNMSMGVGFIASPFLSGIFVHHFGFNYLFFIPLGLVIINWAFVYFMLPETLKHKNKAKEALLDRMFIIRKAFGMRELRFIFLGLLLFNFGWSFFTEFICLFLKHRFDFLPKDTGIFMGYTSFFYALSAGFLISPIIRKVGARLSLLCATLFSGLYILVLLLIHERNLLWYYTPLSQFLLAFIYPTVSTVISNNASNERQGEAMGIYQSINALGMAVSPFFSGSLIGVYPFLAVLVGGGMMVCAAIAFSPQCLVKQPAQT